MKTLKEISQTALWAITGTPGARFVREIRADTLGLSRPRQCQAFGVSVWATDDELDAAREVWLARLPNVAAMIDEMGARTMDEALTKLRALKAKADSVDRMKAEIAEIREEMRKNANTNHE